MLCSLTANQSLMWSQGLMWCPVTLHKHKTFETFRLWLLLFPMCRLAVVCISSAVPLDKVVCFFIKAQKWWWNPFYFFFDLNAWSLDVLLYFDRECVLETVMEMFSVHRCIHVCPVITAPSLLWWRTIIKSRATKAPFFPVTMVVEHSGVDWKSSLHRFCCPLVLDA